MPEGGSQDLRRLREDWETLGRVDPLWAVYVSQEQRQGRWQVDEFLRTGDREVADSWAQHERLLGFAPPHEGIALDFGCGVGRLSTALAQRMARVIGVDISRPMLMTAGEVMPSWARARTTLVLNSSPSIPLRSATIDLVYSSLVLQHMSESLALGYLREFVRVLRPGGTAIVQVAEQPDASVKGYAFKFLPPWLYGLIQRHVLRYPAPMRMQRISEDAMARVLAGTPARIVASWEDATYGGHWRYTRVLITREDE